MAGNSSTFPREAFIAVSLFGLITFSTCLGASISVSDIGSWLLKQPDNLVTLIGSGLVGGSLLLTARTMQADRQAKIDEARSRRMEQYATRLKDFRTLQTNAAIMMILNFDRNIVLRDGKQAERICWDDVAAALVPGCFRRYLYEPTFTAIRDCFNDLIEGMSRLHFLLTHHLLPEEEVDHICKPLLDRVIRDPMFAQQAVARNLRLYILWRNPRGVLHLCDRYNLPIRSMRENDVQALLLELNEDRYGEWEFTEWGTLDTPHSSILP